MRDLMLLENAVNILNRSRNEVVGLRDHLHWPLFMVVDPDQTSIEAFLQDSTACTNVLGVLNAIVGFTDLDTGYGYRIGYDKEQDTYHIHKYESEFKIDPKLPG